MSEAKFTKGIIVSCTTCGDDFEPSEAAIKKHNWKCKKCRRERSRQDRERRKLLGLKVSGTKMGHDYHSAYQKEYNQRDYVKAKNIESFYKQISTEEGERKHRCRIKTRSLIKSGKLTKCNCEHCGSSKKIEAHHENYDDPFNVMWLCKLCHANLHAAKARGEL